MTNAANFLQGSIIRRNGSKLPGPNTFRVTQVQVSESGKLIRYIARNDPTGAMISINATQAQTWHLV